MVALVLHQGLAGLLGFLHRHAAADLRGELQGLAVGIDAGPLDVGDQFPGQPGLGPGLGAQDHPQQRLLGVGVTLGGGDVRHRLGQRTASVW